ncbi:MAG: cob(I)yrinic acid a,c-diamide adenosyltransferase [Candidatus Thorarchaeota archaeon]
MKIYTKNGDKGKTALFGGKKVSKDDLRVQAYGELDELNSIIGLAINKVENLDTSKILQEIQNQIFAIGSDLATPPEENKLREKINIDYSSFTEELEKKIDQWEKELHPLKSFILPGGSDGSNYLHLARTVCRRAERSIITLSNSENINNSIIPYINRLSDLLFVLARSENYIKGIVDKEWIHPSKRI